MRGRANRLYRRQWIAGFASLDFTSHPIAPRCAALGRLLTLPRAALELTVPPTGSGWTSDISKMPETLTYCKEAIQSNATQRGRSICFLPSLSLSSSSSTLPLSLLLMLPGALALALVPGIAPCSQSSGQDKWALLLLFLLCIIYVCLYVT